MLETMRNLVHTEATHETTPKNEKKMEEMRRKQTEMEEELGRKNGL